LPQHERENGCQGRLPEMEAQLRESQCRDALSAIRISLHSKQHLITFRNANITGQIRVTRARTLTDHIGVRIDALAQKYNNARDAVLALKGDDHGRHLRKLEKNDLRLVGEGEAGESAAARSDRTASKKMRKIGGRPARDATTEATSDKPPVWSWIWSAYGALDDREEELHECECSRGYLSRLTNAPGIGSIAHRMVEGEGVQDALGGGSGVTARGDAAGDPLPSVGGDDVGGSGC
jgi:hypothetical protein